VSYATSVHVYVIKIRLSLEKPRTTPISVSFLFSGAELKKMELPYDENGYEG